MIGKIKFKYNPEKESWNLWAGSKSINLPNEPLSEFAL